MRVLSIVPDIAVEASGPSYSVLRLCESLIEQAQDVTLAVLDWTPLAAPIPFVKAFALGAGPRRLGRSPAMRRWLFEQLAERAPAIVHNHSLWMMPNVYAGQFAKRYDIPLIVSPHGTLSPWALQSGSLVKRLFWPLLQYPAIQAARCFQATCESEYQDIRRLGFRQPVCCIPNGIDLPPFVPKAANARRTLLFLGRVHPVKGVDLLLRAWQTVAPRFPDWDLRLVGPDNQGYLSKMLTLSETLELKRVTFCGPRYGKAKWQAYADAELYVLPTHSENFGISVAESLASATPAIVTHGAPWSGLPVHQAGWWIERGVDALIACLEDALGRAPDDLAAMGRRGRAWMQEDFSWSRIGFKMIETHDWIIHGTNRPAWVHVD